MGPVLTSTSTSVARNAGKYLLLLRLLHPIAPEVFGAIMQVYEYYVSQRVIVIVMCVIGVSV